MTCDKVHRRLAGYLDDASVSPAPSGERTLIRQHLESCEDCREELQRYRKMAVMLSRVPRAVPPADLAVKIKVAASQAQGTAGLERRAGSASRTARRFCWTTFSGR